MFTRIAKDLPITRKLILIMVSTSALAVIVASVLFGITEAIGTRNSVAENLATLGGVIGTNSTAAITFEDEELANDVLKSLAANPEIEHAQMFLRDGRIIASFSNRLPIGHDDDVDPQLAGSMLEAVARTGESAQHFYGLRHLEAVYPVHFDRELIGFLHLRTSLEDLANTLQRIYLLAAGTVLLAILVAVAVAVPLQSVISRPIVALSNLMKQVTSEKNYSIRAYPKGSDEIGELMRGFNEMLEQISLRDEQLEEARDAALSASRAKSDFLARMSHEIRTPMNGVLGMTELLLAAKLGMAERRFAETIQQSGETLLAVINDILDFSKIEAGKLTLDATDFDLADVVESIVGLLYNAAHGQGVELISAIDPNIGTRVVGDPVRVRQVLMNLVGNAIKFTRDGEIVVHLAAEVDEAGTPFFRFAVRDTGIGIPPEKLDLIFASFAQADVSTTREYGGTGLGLAISRQLVELMGGEIGVESRSGEGSTFWFTAPLPAITHKTAIMRKTFASLSGVRALVVDDNATNREILEQQLDAWGVDAVAASSADEALAVLDADDEQLDIVLLDYFMPGKDGLALAADLRARTEPGNPGILMLSSAGPEYDAATMRQAGVDLYVAKPLRRSDLYESIVRVLEGRGEGETINQPGLQAALERTARLGLRVLLVEDIEINLQVARHMLAAIGCRVIEARNGQQALDVLQQQNIDLVLMDCQMPVMDGFTATRQQREREAATGRRVPIVALTANALDEDRDRCLDAGMDDFISKPFNKQTLGDAVAKWAPANAVVVDQVAGGAIEHETLDQIAALDPENGSALVTQIIDAYLDDADSLVASLATAAEASDAVEAARAAHALKSSSANVGARRLSAMFREIEMGARDGDLDALRAAFDEAATEYAAVVSALNETRRTLAA